MSEDREMIDEAVDNYYKEVQLWLKLAHKVVNIAIALTIPLKALIRAIKNLLENYGG